MLFRRAFSLTISLLISYGMSTAAAAGHNWRTGRAMGLSLNDWCYDGPNAAVDAKCSLPGTFCALPENSADGRGICKCKVVPALFEEAGSPADHCVPTPTVPLDQAECDTTDDCSQLPNTVCKGINTTSVRKTCTCKDEFEPEVAPKFGCKAVTCSNKGDMNQQNSWCNGRMPGSLCGMGGKCVCQPGRALLLKSDGIAACVDPSSITCNVNEANSCPAPLSGSSFCVLGKCSCQIGGQSGLLKLTSLGFECQENTIGSLCSKSSDCPDTVACLKKEGKPLGVCGCSAYRKPNQNGLRCELALGQCCRSGRDCGMAPLDGKSLPFQCLKTASTESAGSCGCPVNSFWDYAGSSCKMQTMPGVCGNLDLNAMNGDASRTRGLMRRLSVQ